MKKIIFLDVDETLTTPEYTNQCASQGIKGKELAESLDPSCLRLIERLCQETNAEVVIISDWRRNEEPITKRLKRLGLNVKFFKDPVTIITNKPDRRFEIFDFLRKHKDEIDSFVIIDDDPYKKTVHPFLAEHHVRAVTGEAEFDESTDSYQYFNYGLREHHYKPALDILNTPWRDPNLGSPPPESPPKTPPSWSR